MHHRYFALRIPSGYISKIGLPFILTFLFRVHMLGDIGIEIRWKFPALGFISEARPTTMAIPEVSLG